MKGAESAEALIVGAGAAGICAAIEAAAKGARVRVFESQSEPGGTARTAGGGCFMAGSPLQERLGIDDSPDRALEDWLAWGGPEVDVDWAGRYIEGSVPELYAWLAELGVEWLEVNWNEGNRAPRWHSPRDGGLGVMTVLYEAAQRYPISWRFGTRVTDLLVEGGRVVGLVSDGQNGARAEYRAPAVLIASGGFNNNLEMVRRFASAVPDGGRILLGGGYGALGEGHKILERVGAEFVNMGSVWMYPFATPDYRDGSGLRGLVVRGLEGDVWVNSQGRRFHNEAQRGGATGTPALLAQRPATCWSIIDARIAARFNVSDPTYRRGNTALRDQLQRLLDESPFISHGDTLEDLAENAVLDRQALRETIEDHNRTLALDLETDPDFGRPLGGLEPLSEPPFYAIEFFPLARKNLGGVRTDLECRVLRPDGEAIPGLFAAGEVAGMAGGKINGRAALEGTMLGPSLYSGRVAGRSVVR